MDFKQYVKMILEADKKAEDKNKKSEDFDDEDEDEDLEDDDEEEASCKTHKKDCTGCEASVSNEDYDLDEDYEDYDYYDLDEDYDEPHNKTLKESMIYSSNYINGAEYNVINEEKEISMVLTESIKNNSASKFLGKMSKKVEKDSERFAKKGQKENAKTAKEAAKALKEASSKLYKAETDYRAGRPEAKREYKKLCRQYSKILKQKGKVLKGIGRFTGALAGTVAGAALLGAAGLTAMANDDIIERLQNGIKNGDLTGTLKTMAINDKEALINLVDTFKTDGLEAAINKGKDINANAYKTDGYNDGSFKENVKDANEQLKNGAKELKDDLVEKHEEKKEARAKKAKKIKDDVVDTITRKKETSKGVKAGSYARGDSGMISSGYGRR